MQTDENMRRIQQIAAESEQVNVTFAVAGTGNRMDANTEEGGEQRGEMTVQLMPGSTTASEEAEMNRLREEMNLIPGASYKFSRPTFFSFKTPVEIEVSGYDLDGLGLVSRDIVQRLEADGMFTDVRTSMEMGSPEVQIIFDRQRAASLDLTPNQISDRIVRSVRGDVATRFSRNDRKIDVLVRTPEDARSSVESIRNLVVNPDSDRPVTLSAVADVRIENGPTEIRRSGQERVAVVTANLASGDLGMAAERIESILASSPRQAGIVARLAGQNKEMADSFSSLQFALILAVFLVYLVMASQFESLLHPFVILFSIPMAAVGAILALWITGTTVSIVVFIGLIMLAGIVVNNAIILIDKINQLRASGMEKVAATIEAGANRLRPILMTTLTTVLGLLPLAIGLGEGAEMRAPMAITVIGGLMVSTLLTLLVIPSVYLLLDRKKFAADMEVVS
jgi:HAE1 family hydrophobic/amphiphilic exporter-1